MTALASPPNTGLVEAQLAEKLRQVRLSSRRPGRLPWASVRPAEARDNDAQLVYHRAGFHGSSLGVFTMRLVFFIRFRMRELLTLSAFLIVVLAGVGKTGIGTLAAGEPASASGAPLVHCW